MKDNSLRRQWNESCLKAGLPSLTTGTAAKLMAILLHYGNNETFTHSAKFLTDCLYIMRRFHIEAGETPDEKFMRVFQPISRELEGCEVPPKWAIDLMKDKYAIKIY